MCVQKDQFYSSFVFRLQCTKAPAAAGCVSYKHGPNEAINQVLEQKHIMSSPIDHVLYNTSPQTPLFCFHTVCTNRLTMSDNPINITVRISKQGLWKLISKGNTTQIYFILYNSHVFIGNPFKEVSHGRVYCNTFYSFMMPLIWFNITRLLCSLLIKFVRACAHVRVCINWHFFNCIALVLSAAGVNS